MRKYVNERKKNKKNKVQWSAALISMSHFSVIFITLNVLLAAFVYLFIYSVFIIFFFTTIVQV